MSQQPIVYAPSPIAVHQRPIYLYVPQAQQANWGRYCGGYRACGQPVYFVHEDWVRTEYRREHDQRNARNKSKDHDRHDNRGGNGQHRGHDKHGD